MSWYEVLMAKQIVIESWRGMHTMATLSTAETKAWSNNQRDIKADGQGRQRACASLKALSLVLYMLLYMDACPKRPCMNNCCVTMHLFH